MPGKLTPLILTAITALPAGAGGVLAGVPTPSHASTLQTHAAKKKKVCKTVTKKVHGKKTRVKQCKLVKVKPKPAPTATPTPTSSPPLSGSFSGSNVNFRFGSVQVTVVIDNGKIADVKANASPDTARSTIIDQQALPALRQEVLQAQGASIDMVSGATLTSEAFLRSLQSALQTAGK
jgi:uncharacterized protein with FMN-binding domain